MEISRRRLLTFPRGDRMSRWNSWARIAWWGLVVVALGVVVAGVPAAPGNPIFLASNPEEVVKLNFSVDTTRILSFVALFVRMLMVVGFLAAAVIIFWQRSNDKSAMLFSALLVTAGVTNGVINYIPDPSPALKAFETLADFLTLLVLYTFPDGRLVPRWGGWLLGIWLAYLVVAQMDWLPGDATEDILDLVLLSSGILALLYRYRIAQPDQRQQIKWVVFGATAIILIAYALNLIHYAALSYFPPTSVVIIGYEIFRTIAQMLTLLLLPLVLTISITRYHLWDIDFYINRGLVYGFLTILLGIVFFLSTLALQNLSLALFGNQYSSIFLTASAVIIAILFQPVRQQLQQFVDRRFFGVQVIEARSNNSSEPPALVVPLSAREQDVLGFIDAGLSNREIAEQLFLTVGTVKWHTNNIYTKLGVNSRTQALVRAREYNVLVQKQ
jgi:DNA-binding CsgD family transcriptional regulator